MAEMKQLRGGDGGQPPVTIQPGRVLPPVPPGSQQLQMAAPTTTIPGCPPGLEYLTTLDQLLSHQVVELLQAFTGWETKNKYVVKNSLGQQVYYVFEEADFCMRSCCGSNRGFVLHVTDNYANEVMRISRPFKCCTCGPCCAGICTQCTQELVVEAPPGQLIGKVTQMGSCCTTDFQVEDAQGEAHLVIKGPCLQLFCRCCSDIDYPIFGKDGTTKVGNVTKQWSGLGKEMFTQADNFGITCMFSVICVLICGLNAISVALAHLVPEDLDVKLKAALLGAMFLIDFMAFEQKNN